MTLVKQNTGREEVEKKKFKNAFSHRKMEDDDIIIPPEYKENTGWGSILLITAGLVIGMMVVFFLIMPARTKALNTKHNQELLSYSQNISDLNQQLASLTEDYDQLNARAEEMESQLATAQADQQAVLDQYQRVIGILQALDQEEMNTAAQLYAALDPSLITDESVTAVVNQINGIMAEEGYPVLAELGTAAWNGGNLEEAVLYYEKSLQLSPDNTEVMYLLGRVYQEQGNTELANQYFTTIIDQYPDSEQAEPAREARGY